MTCTNYIMDFEEAIADLSECFDYAFSKAFKQFEIHYERSKLEEYVITPINEIFERYYHGCTCKYRDFVTLFMSSFDDAFSRARTRPGIVDKVRELCEAGCRLGIISECYEMYVHRLLSENGIDHCFSSVVGMDRTAIPRPDSHVLDICLKEMGAYAKNTIMIASSERNRIMCQHYGMSVESHFSE